MIKVKKIGNDGLEHEYWQHTEEELAEIKKRQDEMMDHLDIHHEEDTQNVEL